jgi:hypothetical protein
MTHQDQNAALLNQLRKHGEEMFHGATIQELTSLVDEVMRTHETNVMDCVDLREATLPRRTDTA